MTNKTRTTSVAKRSSVSTRATGKDRVYSIGLYKGYRMYRVRLADGTIAYTAQSPTRSSIFGKSKEDLMRKINAK